MGSSSASTVVFFFRPFFFGFGASPSVSEPEPLSSPPAPFSGWSVARCSAYRSISAWTKPAQRYCVSSSRLSASAVVSSSPSTSSAIGEPGAKRT
jgi:hypothetical protein